MAYLELKNVSKSYIEDGQTTEVLSNINLDIEEGEFVAIVGFSGSGKTTLANLINGLLSPTEGEVLFRGEPIRGTSQERGMIFQNYSLLPWLTVYQNIEMAVSEAFKSKPKSFVRERTLRYIDMVSLSHATDKVPSELSGGMRQRVSVARALAMAPEMLVMDEPLSALDALTRGNLQNEILRIWNKDKRTVLMITNDVDEGLYMADRIIPLRPGPNATLGPAFEVNVARPRNKHDLNENSDYQHLRNSLIKYLMDIAHERTAHTDTVDYALPELAPKAFA